MNIDQFMTALSGQESGGSYTAQNSRTGAYGRFQIMPSNWPAWSQEAGLGPNAPQTPENQEAVARFKLQQYYDKFGNWRDVAAAWYSGSPESSYNDTQLNRKQGPNGDEPSIKEYVDNVMARAGDSGGGASSNSQYGDYRAGLIKRANDVQALIQSGYQNMPDPNADDPTAYNAWVQQMKLLLDEQTNLNASIGRTDQEFANQNTAANTGIRLDELNAQIEGKNIDRFLGGLQESRGRADLIAKENELVSKYGSPSGKTSFSYNDLGAGFAAEAKRMGIDPNAALVNYPGTLAVDPRHDLATYDAQFGVTGAIPTVAAPQTSRSEIPKYHPISAAAGLGEGILGALANTTPAQAAAAQSEIDTSPSSLRRESAFSPWTVGAGQNIGGAPSVLGMPLNAIDRVKALIEAAKNKTPASASAKTGGGIDWGYLLGGSDRKLFGISGSDLSGGLQMPTGLFGTDNKFFGMGSPKQPYQPPAWVPPWQQTWGQ